MRCFVAARPAGDIRAAASELARRACSQLPGVKLVPAGNIHLTLQFLGEIPEGDVEQLSKSLDRAAAGFAPFRAGFTGLGAFPSIWRAMVLWGAIGEGVAEYQALGTRVCAATTTFALKKEENSTVPHLTLARFRAPVDLSRLEVFAELMQTELGMCTIASFALMRSHLGPAGPVYEELCSYELKP